MRGELDGVDAVKGGDTNGAGIAEHPVHLELGQRKPQRICDQAVVAQADDVDVMWSDGRRRPGRSRPEACARS